MPVSGKLFENRRIIMVTTPVKITFEITETGKTFKFVRKAVGAPIEFILRDEYGLPRAGKKYSIKVGTQTYEGKTGDDGLVSQKLPASAQIAELTVWLDDEDPENTLSYRLNIGPLPPIEDPKGVQVRLMNLGFYSGEINGQMDELTTAAIAEFQNFIGQPNPTGTMDESTRAELVKLHDGGE
jgi:Putative peptidoglycan binding domain